MGREEDLSAQGIEVRILEHVHQRGGQRRMETRIELVNAQHLAQPQGVDGGTDSCQPGESSLTLLINIQLILLPIGPTVPEDEVPLELLEHLRGNLRLLVLTPGKKTQDIKHLLRNLLLLEFESDDT